jgi:hypothetical protein
MIVLVTDKSIMWSKLPNNAFLNFDLMKKGLIRRSNQLLGILTSWKMKKNLISWIWPHDQKFDLLKKLNFDLMKFDLMIISLYFELNKLKKHYNFEISNFKENTINKQYNVTQKNYGSFLFNDFILTCTLCRKYFFRHGNTRKYLGF